MGKKERVVIGSADVELVGDAPLPRFKQNPVARRAMRIYGAFWRRNPEHVAANESAFREQSEALAVDVAFAGDSAEMVVHKVVKQLTTGNTPPTPPQAGGTLEGGGDGES